MPCRRCGCSYLVGPCSWWGSTHELTCTPWGVGLCLQQPAWKRQLMASDWDVVLPGWWFSSSLRWLDGGWWFSSLLTWSVLGSTLWFYAFFTHAHHKWFTHIPVLKDGVTQTVCQGWPMRSSCVPRSHFAISSNLVLHGQNVGAHPPSVPLCTARLLNAARVWWDCFVFLTFWSFSVNKNPNSLQGSNSCSQKGWMYCRQLRLCCVTRT